MKIRLIALILVSLISRDIASAQTPPSPPRPPAPPAPVQAPAKPAEPAPPPALFNIRVDVVVTEEGGGEAMTRKEASVTVGDARRGSVRSGGATNEGKPFSAPARLWVDVQPRLVMGKINTQVTMSYLSPPHFTREGEQKLEVLLENGKPLVVSQTSSATSERRMKVEVTATILK